MSYLNKVCIAEEHMNLNPILRKRVLNSRGVFFDLFVYINGKEKVKPSSIVQLEESIGFKLCFKWICLCSVLDHFLKSILIDLKGPLWALKRCLSMEITFKQDYNCILKFTSKIDFSLNIIILLFQETNHMKLCNCAFIFCWKFYRILLRWSMPNVRISDWNIIITWELVRNADAQATPRPPESKSTFNSDLWVVCKCTQVWEVLFSVFG